MMELNHGKDLFAAAIHPDGKSTVTGDLFGKIQAWEGFFMSVTKAFAKT